MFKNLTIFFSQMFQRSMVMNIVETLAIQTSHRFNDSYAPIDIIRDSYNSRDSEDTHLVALVRFHSTGTLHL